MRIRAIRSQWQSLCLCAALTTIGASVSVGSPISEPFGTGSPNPTSSVAAADLSGWYSTCDTLNDSIDIRDVRQSLIRHISREEIVALAPWMELDASDDGPKALAWTDSGRSLFIVVTDSSPSSDGLGSDVVLRYDTTTQELTRFTRAEIGNGAELDLAAMHFKGKLWVSTQSGNIRVYHAGRNDIAGSLFYEWSLPNNEVAVGMALARSLALAFVVSETTLYRIDLTQPFAIAQPVGSVVRGRSVAFSDHFGGPWHEGAYVVEGAGEGLNARVIEVPWFQATGLLPYAPIEYIQSTAELCDIAGTACGRLLLAGSSGAELIRDSDDSRLDYEAWIRDEFDQVVRFAQGLISPDGEPAGWVIDADVTAGGIRFHPASPDGAAWVIMLHIAKDHIANDEGSKPIIREILLRYAGLMPDGISPQVTSDGIMRHWYDPLTGNGKAGWDPEYATLSTMLLVTAADRARRFYSDDLEVVEAANVIIDRVQGWESYIQPGSNALYLKAVGSGGPNFGSAGSPFYEGVMFVEQAATYGTSDAALSYWLDRGALPESEYVTGFPMTSNWPGNHLPAFVSLYPWIAQSPMRSDATWETHIKNLLASNGAWTDDFGPNLMTVFSAGTTRSDWGGYHADSLSDHPGDVTTFPSLMAFSSLGQTAASVGAYHAYRHGARQEFASGASLLFRRSQEAQSYTPTDAGLSDVVIGALGLAELMRPGLIDAVLAVSYQPECPADFAEPSGTLNFFDVSAFLSAFNNHETSADLSRPFGQFNFFDVSAYLAAYGNGCP